MKSLSRLLGTALAIGWCLSTAEAATISLTYAPSSGDPVTVSATIPNAAEPTVQAAIMADPVCGFVSTTITTPAVAAVMAADGVTVVTPAVPAGTATQRNPATFAQALQCIAGQKWQGIVDQINAGIIAQAQAAAAAAAKSALVTVTAQ